MKSFSLSRSLVALLVAAGSLWAASASAQQAVTVVEYYNKSIAAYFLTGRASEQTSLDAVADFQRTGVTFVATSATGAVAPLDSVCRYRVAIPNSNLASPGQPFSSHFYGLTGDCATVAGYNLPNFFNEGFDFAVERPTNGACPASSPLPVYRALRSLSPVDVPNHRYSVSLSSYQDMLTRGWTGEGVVFCAKSATQETPRTIFASSANYEDRCAVPRVGVSPLTGRAYPDMQGTLTDEKNWVRSWSDETYLWYREIPQISAASYFDTSTYFAQLKTPAQAVSGVAKDKPGFHYTRTTADVESGNAGITYGYGISWSAIRTTPPRQFIAAVVDPGSPADMQGVRRGDSIVSIDGVSFNDPTQAGVNVLNRGLFPSVVGESHTFVLAPASGGATKTVALTSAQLSIQAVPTSGVINTPTGRVGYIAFTTFNSFASEGAIANAIAGLQAVGVNDLVLDLRYNSGGYLYIASQLGYMIAGPSRTNGRTFELGKTNEKKPFGPDEATPFYNVGSGFAGGIANGQVLPTLNLRRVYVLTTPGSCSASEALINGLRGIDVEVILIGSGSTCGKPFGFIGTDNCGTSYFTIQFTGVNAKGQGDYVDGFAPTCVASDDYSKPLGDVGENQLSAALSYRATSACPATTLKALPRVVEGDASLAVGTNSVLTQRAKIIVPPTTPRGFGTPITPREPSDLGRVVQ